LHAPPEPAAEPASFLGLARDRVREHEADSLNRRQEAWLEGLLDSIHDGVWLIGLDGTVEFANHRLAQLFGVSLQQLGRGQPHLQVVEELKSLFRSPEEVCVRWNHLHASPEEMFWDELELLEPRRRVLERFARPLLDAQQRLVGRLEVYRDITAQRLLHDKVLQREKLAAMGQLVSGIAHELNNPLTAVTGYTHLLLNTSLDPALREKVQRLHQEAERAGRIVKNLLLFARGSRAEKQSVDLPRLLEQAVSLRAYELTVKNIQVLRHYAPQLPPVLADPHQLQQVFLNILLNAEHAIRSQRDHGCITLRLHWRLQDNRVRLELSNDGPPVPAPLLPYLFEPFFTTKPAREGTGLGLAISQAIVNEHGGEISVQTAAGEGVTFVVELPAQPLPPPVPEPPPARRWVPADGPEARRVLVVDDEPAVAQLIADALRQQGYTVSLHTRSRHALAEAFAQPFDLAICDIRMPELDGQAFHRSLAEQRPALARRLFFTTGDTLAPETIDFLEQVGLPYLAKPFHVEELRSRVRDLLQQFDHSTALDAPWAPASGP
ncbi:MAG: ATP-binding protein, partial [Terriglobia bacterium]